MTHQRLQMPEDLTEALALGANAAAELSLAMKEVGCVAAHMGNPNYAPVGITKHKSPKRTFKKVSVRRQKALRHRLDFQRANYRPT